MFHLKERLARIRWFGSRTKTQESLNQQKIPPTPEEIHHTGEVQKLKEEIIRKQTGEHHV